MIKETHLMKIYFACASQNTNPTPCVTFIIFINNLHATYMSFLIKLVVKSYTKKLFEIQTRRDISEFISCGVNI